MNQHVCPLCGEAVDSHAQRNSEQYRCQICGTFAVEFRALRILEQRSDKAMLSGVCRNRSESQDYVTLTDQNIDELASLAPRSTDIAGKARKLIEHLARNSEYPGKWVKFSARRDRAVCYASNREECYFLIEYVKDHRWLSRIEQDVDHTCNIIVSPAGWHEIQNSEGKQSTQGFVAMAFHEEMKSAYNDGIFVALAKAGYKSLRTDQEQFNTKIDDLIIAEIRRSRFVIADATLGRNAVYFEAGFAMALGLPVIWTCREDNKEHLSFDTRQFNHIIWTSTDDLANKLTLRIQATIGQGPLDVDKLLRERT